MFRNKVQDDESREDIKPNIFINPADYPRYVTSALIYSQAIERTKHVIYKNKCLAHRDQSRYQDHVTIVEKRGSQRRPWYHVHQCLDENCPVHPENIRLPNVKEVNLKQDGIPSFLCSYLKDRVDISLYPYYRASIRSFNASFTTKGTPKKRRKDLTCLWHDPHCQGCENKDLHECPVEDKVFCEEEYEEGGVNVIDISDILYKYRFLFTTEYMSGPGEKDSTSKAKDETNETNGNIKSSNVCASKIKTDEHNVSLAGEVNEISTCIGQVPRTPTRQYSTSRYNTPRYQTPNRSPFFNWKQRHNQSNSPSPYFTPRQYTPNKYQFYHGNLNGQSASTISPYSPTCLPYPSSSPYSTPPRHVLTPPIYQTNPYTQYYSLLHSSFQSNTFRPSDLVNHYGYQIHASAGQGFVSYAQDMPANYRGWAYPYWYSDYNHPRSKSYSNDYYRSETDSKSYDEAEYDSEDPLITRETRSNDDRKRESKYCDTGIERRRSYDSSYKLNNDKRDNYRHSSRDRDHGRRSSFRRDRESTDLDRKRRNRSPSSSSSKRSKHTHSCNEYNHHVRRSSRKSTSNHSMSSEATINYSELSPRKSSESRRKSVDASKYKDGDRKQASSGKSIDGHRHATDKKKSSERHTRHESKTSRNCRPSSKRLNSSKDSSRSSSSRK